MVFYEIQQALGSGFWTPTRICQESSFKYKHATVFFISSFFSGMNTTPKTWIFRVHSRIYPLLQWNILSFEDSCQKSHVKMTAWLGLVPSFHFFHPLLSFSFYLFPFSPFFPCPLLILSPLSLILKDRVPCSVCLPLSTDTRIPTASSSKQSIPSR